MSDPIGSRLRDYYRSIDADAPERLVWNVSSGFDHAPHARRVSGRSLAGFVGLGLAAAVVAALAFAALGPRLEPSPSAPVAGSVAPTTTPTASPSPSSEPPATNAPMPSPMGETNTPGPTGTAAATPTPMPTPTPAPTGLGSFGKPFANSIGRSGYTATALSDGRVLIAGGIGSGSGSPVGRLSIAQIWDPATGKFTTTGSLNVPRVQHTATLLDNGKVLIAGGGDLMDGIDNLASAELYDPKTGKFTMTGSMSVGRAYHTATRLADGKILIAGGYGGGTEPVASAEIYDPNTGQFTRTGSMAEARDRHTATFINGLVLVAGGVGLESNALASAELYDPSTGRFTPTEPLNAARYGQAATSFESAARPDVSYVLLAGGTGSNGEALASAEVFVYAQGNFGMTNQPMHVARPSPQAVEVAPGVVLVLGGSSGSAEFFDVGGTFRSAGPIPGSGETATVFGACKVLLSAPGGKTWQVFSAADCPPAV